MNNTTKTVIDLETGGFSEEKNAICQIGILVFHNDQLLKEVSVYLEPYDKTYHPEAMEVNGIDNYDLIIKGFPLSVAKNLLDHYFEQTDILIGHNIKAFDWRFLKQFYTEQGDDISKFDLEIVDTKLMAGQQKYAKTNLSYLCKELYITNEKPHEAISDCKATWDLYQKLENDKSIF